MVRARLASISLRLNSLLDGIQTLLVVGLYFFFFFFQAEDGIRDKLVTGVQTCALPISLEFGDDVVVVGVEPLRHLHRGDVAAFSLAAPRHGEVGIEIDLAPLPAVARRHGAYQRAGIQHPIVEREIVDGDAVQADVALQLPVAAAQLYAGGEELGATHFAAPIALGGALQFARGAEGGEAQIRGDCHSKEGNLTGFSAFTVLGPPAGVRYTCRISYLRMWRSRRGRGRGARGPRGAPAALGPARAPSAHRA